MYSVFLSSQIPQLILDDYMQQDDKECHDFFAVNYYGPLLRRLYHGKTESSYISIYDTIFKSAAEYFEIEFDRDTSRGTSTQNCRPDLALYQGGHCFFRGEEKKENNMGPAEELTDKLVWNYGGLR